MDHQDYFARRQSLTTEAEREGLFKEALERENLDRERFSKERASGLGSLAVHPHPSLIPVFERSLTDFSIDPAFENNDTKRCRVFRVRNRVVGKPAIASNMAEFRRAFDDVFCEGMLRNLNWNNVFAAGGSILACLQKIPDDVVGSTGKTRNYFRTKYPTSDIDLFLYRLNEEEGKRKIQEIYELVQEACPCKVVCFRSSSAVTLVSQYPYRHIQIVLRLYSSPYEILAGFDVDASTLGYDGKQVYADIRAHHALTKCCNTVDLTRRSPSYEVRLAKYGMRGFEVDLDWLERDMIDPSIFIKPWHEVKGLARLLVLERLRTKAQRDEFLGVMTMGRNKRPTYVAPRFGANPTAAGSLEMSNYSTVFLPWGDSFDADFCMKLMLKKDHGLNRAYHFKNRGGYCLHPCFFGTAKEVS